MDEVELEQEQVLGHHLARPRDVHAVAGPPGHVDAKDVRVSGWAAESDVSELSVGICRPEASSSRML